MSAQVGQPCLFTAGLPCGNIRIHNQGHSIWARPRKLGATTGEGKERALAPAALACMGIVFGDIGTSPLYTLSVTVKSASPSGSVSPEAVLGVVSLIFWSLISSFRSNTRF